MLIKTPLCFEYFSTSEWVNVLCFDAGMVNRRTGSRWRGMQTDEQQQQQQQQRSHCVLLTVRAEPWRNKQRLTILICPHSWQKKLGIIAGWRRLFKCNVFSVCLCRWTGRRRWITLAVNCWVNDLRNSRRSQRTEKAVLWEMNVTGKQQPELIERPASLLVPTSASKPVYLDLFYWAWGTNLFALFPWDVLCAGRVTKMNTQKLFSHVTCCCVYPPDHVICFFEHRSFLRA